MLKVMFTAKTEYLKHHFVCLCEYKAVLLAILVIETG